MVRLIRTLGALVVSSLLVAAAVAQAPAAQANRVPDSVNLSARVQLSHQLPAWVNPSRDAGEAAGTEIGLTFVLARSPELQAAFDQLLADQQNPSSPRFHQWLTPQQIGDQYGPTRHDIAALTSWLSSAGLTVKDVTPSKIFIHAYGPASAAGAALGTSFRMFSSSGKTHFSAATEPVIPSAFASVIASIGGLTDVELHPMSHVGAPVASSNGIGGARPDYTISSTTHYVFPGDFAVIFDINPLYGAGINGAGQRVAVIGRSQVSASDITAFEGIANIASNVPNIIIAGSNPGTVSGDESESDLDLQRVIGTAPGVTADFVISGTVNGYNGIYVAAQYEVQTVLDPVLTLSYGGCEYNAGASGVSLWSTLFSQAAAEGISVFVSSADSGVDTCDSAFVAPPAATSGIYQGKSINYICSNPYTTCVGGTEFNDTASPAAYWSSTNGTGYTSALSYIPEAGWNEPGAAGSYIVASSGGGPSTLVAKPSFQAGVGVPADGFRDVPDVAFPAAGHDGYIGCEADLIFSATANGNCATGGAVVFSGTSAAAPSWAGVAALLNQKAGFSQGNLNPLIYRLAANTANGAFHDVTLASSGFTTCDITTASMCNNTLPLSATVLTGGVQGYAVGAGYDQVTGWGSPDVAKFVAAAVLTDPGFTIAASPTTLSFTAGSTTGNTSTITYSSVQGFTGAITTTCTIAYSSGTASIVPTCAVSAPATVAANGTATATVTITSVAPHAIQSTQAENRKPSLPAGALGGISLATLFLLVSLRRRTPGRWRALAMLLVLASGLGIMSGCSGSGGSNTVTTTPVLSGGTMTGAYVVTVIGTSSGIAARTTLSLTIK